MQLLNELQNKIADSDESIRVIGDNALDIQDRKINMYKPNEKINKNNKFRKETVFKLYYITIQR